MTSYLQLFMLILPVFGVMAIGVFMRKMNALNPVADESLLKLVVNVLYPCIIF